MPNMNSMDEAMIGQLRKLSIKLNIPSVSNIADRMQQLAEQNARIQLIPLKKKVD
tara:strand:+ start:1329 stop:1493 length:165 start_codon:yes stop_codon:yes gene_type:complete